METTIKINIPEDFSTLCCIYEINPEVYLQTVVDQISFPSYYSNAMGNDRWATFCFLNFLQVEESKYKVNEQLEEKFLNEIESCTNYNIYANAAETAESRLKLNHIMHQWLKAVLTERSSYLTDYLTNGD